MSRIPIRAWPGTCPTAAGKSGQVRQALQRSLVYASPSLFRKTVSVQDEGLESRKTGSVQDQRPVVRGSGGVAVRAAGVRAGDTVGGEQVPVVGDNGAGLGG